MPINNISASDHYRDMALQAEANRSARMSEANLGMQDFLRLLVAQLQNQDMMNPMDNTEFIAQMAQFSMLTAMNNMAEQTMTSHAVSLVGQEVTAAEIHPQTGVLETIQGVVTGVSLFERDGPMVFIEGRERGLPLQSIMIVGSRRPGETPPAGPAIRTENLPEGRVGAEYDFRLEATGTGDAELTWSITSGVLPEGLTFAEDGRITGIPLQYGNFSITVQVTDGDELTLSRSFVFAILQADNDPPPNDDGNGDNQGG